MNLSRFVDFMRCFASEAGLRSTCTVYYYVCFCFCCYIPFVICTLFFMLLFCTKLSLCQLQSVLFRVVALVTNTWQITTDIVSIDAAPANDLQQTIPLIRVKIHLMRMTSVVISCHVPCIDRSAIHSVCSLRIDVHRNLLTQLRHNSTQTRCMLL